MRCDSRLEVFVCFVVFVALIHNMFFIANHEAMAVTLGFGSSMAPITDSVFDDM